MITYIKTAFTNPKDIYIGRNMKNAHTFYLLLLTTALLTFISLFQYIPILNSIGDDFNEIKESIPTFALKNNEITSENESYIYKTDSMIFYFDPDNRMDTETIDRNMNRINAPLATALLKEGLYMNVVGQDYYLPYKQVENLTTTDIETLITSFGEFSTTTMLIFVLVVFIVHFFLFVYELLPITLFANIIAIAMRLKLKLFQTFKIALLAVIPLALGISLIHTFIFPVPYQFEIVLIMTLFIFYRSISTLKEKLINNKK